MLCPASALDRRFDESYGGEDAVFSADAPGAGHPPRLRPGATPRLVTTTTATRFAKLRRQQARVASAAARVGTVQQEGMSKRISSRVPLHYFALLRLPVRFLPPARRGPAAPPPLVRLLPLMAVGEWTLGVYAVRYAVRPRRDLRRPARGRLPAKKL